MKIGLVSDTYTPQVNGVTTVVRRIAALLRAHGHEVALVAPRYPAAHAPADGRELRVPSAPFPFYSDVRLSLPSFRAVAEFFDRSQPEVVHVHTEGTLGTAGRRYALRRGLPLVTSFHTNFPRYTRDYGVGVLEPVVWRWLEWFHRPARITFTPGESVRDELARRGIGHAAVWGRGVDPRFFHPARRHAGWRRWLAGGDDTAIVLHVGRLAREKNLEVLIAAWDEARRILGQRATFVVAGEGPLARRIAARLPFVRLLGFLPREDLATLYASADLCVFPSHTETCGLVALEAMASGAPVIAADAGGFRESVRSGVTGLLVAPGDPRAYAAAIADLVGDTERRFAWAAAAREHVLARDVTQENAELLERYGELAGCPDRGSATCAA
jgi:phosphatidylinositol alpha 1,6-mannosyltransferase